MDFRSVIVRNHPPRVVLLGHSYIRRLEQYISRNVVWKNLGFRNDAVEIRFVCLGGATVRPGHRCMTRLMTEVRRLQPDLVYMHVGENDVQVSINISYINIVSFCVVS